jgi:hypothetical protein
MASRTLAQLLLPDPSRSDDLERPSPPSLLLRRLGAVQKLLVIMKDGRQPVLRAAAATALRHWARDGGMRASLAAAGAIPALSLLLQSPRNGARQAAARAISNLVVHSGESCLEAVARLVLDQSCSLIVVLKSCGTLLHTHKHGCPMHWRQDVLAALPRTAGCPRCAPRGRPQWTHFLRFVPPSCCRL